MTSKKRDLPQQFHATPANVEARVFIVRAVGRLRRSASGQVELLFKIVEAESERAAHALGMNAASSALLALAKVEPPCGNEPVLDFQVTVVELSTADRRRNPMSARAARGDRA